MNKTDPYLRYFIAEWPPNTGDPEKDRRKIERIRETLIDGGRVFTPEGRLALENGEVVLKKRRGRTGKMREEET